MIYSYESIQNILDDFKSRNLVEKNPIAYSAVEHLPIRHFTYGNGDYHVVVTACQHGNEIIGASFILELMKYVSFGLKNKNITIHFIPLLNPEGYIVNTSAIFERTKNVLEKKDFYNLYHKLYRHDDQSKSKFKKHQQLFSNIGYNAISDDYHSLKSNVRTILFDHPSGSIIDWASNGNGIDLNSNSTNFVASYGQFNKKNAYSNIRLDIPSPIGHPGCSNFPDFKQEPEIIGLKKLLNELNSQEDKFLGLFNYHSTGGEIYQRPAIDDKDLTIYSYILSKLYQEKSMEYIVLNGFLYYYKKYKIIKTKPKLITSVNDELRTLYKGNLLIELSNLKSNPVGPFINSKSTIDSNVNSFIFTIENIMLVSNISKELSKECNTERVYNFVDNKYKSRIKKQI